MIKTSVICYSLLFILIVLFSTGLFAGIGAGGAPDLVNAGNNARTDSDENHNAKYDIFHDKKPPILLHGTQKRRFHSDKSVFGCAVFS